MKREMLSGISFFVCYNVGKSIFVGDSALLDCAEDSMKVSILTICPDVFDSFLNMPVLARALRDGQLELEVVDIREFAPGSFRHIDDSPFGGGAGMILRCQPVLDALAAVRSPESRTVALTPSGTPYTQKHAHELAEVPHLVLLCGHYEGFDARILKHADEELSIGDYILTGGETAALVLLDSIARLLPGVIRQASTEDESFEDGLLEYPQYTQPADYNGDTVPDVLLSGDHGRIRRWRRQQALRLTRARRPDLFAQLDLSDEDLALLEELPGEP